MSIFSKIKLSRPKRTVHNLSYPMSLSLGFGDLVPVMCEKVVPGDKFIHGHEYLMRFSPFVSQVYQSFQVRTEYFFVPSRLLWSDFDKFLVEDDPTLYPHPSAPLSTFFDGEHTMENTLVDYILKVSGKPRYTDGVFHFDPIDGSAISRPVDILPWYALIKVWLDYYADENLNYFPELLGDGSYQILVDAFDKIVHGDDPQTTHLNTLSVLLCAMNQNWDTNTIIPTDPRLVFDFPKRAYPKDYFTSALPFAQRGPIVQIPLNGEGDVIVTNEGQQDRRFSGVYAYKEGDNVTLAFGETSVGNSTLNAVYGPAKSGSTQLDNANSFIRQDSQSITFKAVNINGTATITDLRTAMTVQSWLEKNARAGVRYKEQLASHFGVRSRDYRLDRAELLQSSRSNVQIGEIFTTAQNSDGTFVPGLGVSTATGSNAVKPFKHFFEEHGYVIGLISIFPNASYSQGLPRQLLELDKFDYYWPEFQHIGEQEIYNCELFLDDDNPSRNMQTFGYTPRYAHYKYRNAETHGDMLNSLNFMRASRQFTSPPNLNNDFIQIDAQLNHLNRIFNAVEPYSNAKPVQCDFFHNFKAIRPMDYFGTPRII